MSNLLHSFCIFLSSCPHLPRWFESPFLISNFTPPNGPAQNCQINRSTAKALLLKGLSGSHSNTEKNMRFLSLKSEPGTNLSREELQSAPSRLERGLLNGPCLFKCPGSRTFLLRLGMSPGMRPPKQKQCPSGCEPHSGSLDDRQPSLCSCKTMHCWMESTLSPPQTSLSFFFFNHQILPVSESELSAIFCWEYY